MAEVDPTTTCRLRLHYNGPFGEHTMLFHGRTGVSESALSGAVFNVVSTFAPLMFSDVVFTSAEFAAAGSPLFFNSLWTTVNSTGPEDPTINSSPSTFMQFGGRGDSDGVRVKLYLFETGFQYRADMRYNAGENADLDDAIAQLQTQDSVIGNIAGNRVIWYNYVNVGQNDYLTHKARR